MNAVHAEIGRQAGHVRKKLGHRFPALAEDIEQEAWACSLASAHRYRRTNPGARGYFYRISLLWCAENVNRWIAVTSLPRSAARLGEGAAQHAVDPKHQVPRAVEASEALPANPGWTLAALRIRWTRGLDRACSTLDETDRAVGYLAVGATGPVRPVTRIARDLKLSKEDVTRSLKVFEKAIRKVPELAALWAEIQHLEQELP